MNCGNLGYIFPISIARDLPQLEILSLEHLPQLKQVFGHEGDGNNSVLSKLRNVILENLPELVSLGGGNSSSVWPSLESLYVVNCPKVKLSLFASVEANVPALEKVIPNSIYSILSSVLNFFFWTKTSAPAFEFHFCLMVMTHDS